MRVNDLSWGHYREVSSVKTIGTNAKGKLYLTDKPDHEAMQKHLRQAETDKLSTREFADLVSQYNRRFQPILVPAVKTKEFPSWRKPNKCKKIRGKARKSEESPLSIL